MVSMSNYSPHKIMDVIHAIISVNTLRLRQYGHHSPDDIFQCIFLNQNVWISIKISLNFGSKGPINDISALVQIMAWRRPGDKPLSELMMVSLLTHIWVKACCERDPKLKYIIHNSHYSSWQLQLKQKYHIRVILPSLNGKLLSKRGIEILKRHWCENSVWDAINMNISINLLSNMSP